MSYSEFRKEVLENGIPITELRCETEYTDRTADLMDRCDSVRIHTYEKFGMRLESEMLPCVS